MKKRLRSLMAMVIATVILASSTFIGSVGYDTSQSPPGSSVIQTDSVLQTVDTPQTDNESIECIYTSFIYCR